MSTFQRNTCLAFVAALFIISLLPMSNEEKSTYALVLDAGSSGTRIYAYKWSHDTKQTVQLPMHLPSLVAIPPNAAPNKIPNKQHSLYERVETNPGVAEAITDRTGRKLSKEALGPLLEWARAVVPRRQRKCTPVFMFMTAGVRKLSPSLQLKLTSDTNSILAASGFRFKPQWARIIQGDEEGAFGWASVNYLRGKLKGLSGQAEAESGQSQSPSDSLTTIPGAVHSTLGTLDLGGSSLEVVREHTDPSTPPSSSSHAHSIALGAYTYTLQTQTYHRFGMGDTFKRSVQLLLQRLALEQGVAVQELGRAGQPEVKVDHPCLQQGYLEPYHILPKGTAYANTTLARVTLRGAFDEEECAHLAKLLVQCAQPRAANNTCNGSQPAITPVGPQAVGGGLIALTGFYVLWQFFGLLEPQVQPRSVLYKAAQHLCARSWEDVNTTHGHFVNLEKYCLWGRYAVELLGEDGLDVAPSAVTIGEKHDGWPLGAMLAMLTSEMPSSLGCRAPSYADWFLGSWWRSPCVCVLGGGSNHIHWLLGLLAVAAVAWCAWSVHANAQARSSLLPVVRPYTRTSSSLPCLTRSSSGDCSPMNAPRGV